jgi:hypothetical protein
MTSPVTPDWPRALAMNGNAKHTTDILKSPDEYRVSIQVNPTVPIVDIFAQAPSLSHAQRLAQATIQGMRDFLGALAVRDRVPGIRQVRLTQLGRPTGGVINADINRKVAILMFVLVFAASAATALFLSRVRRGWRAEAGSSAPPVAPPIHDPAA